MEEGAGRQEPVSFSEPGQAGPADYDGEKGLEDNAQERGSSSLPDLQPAARILYASQLGRARHRGAASDASFESGNQAPLPTGDGGAGARESGKSQPASVRQGQSITFS